MPLRVGYAQAHRWRFAKVETALEKPCLFDPDLRLGAAGDWCLGPRIEAAHDSGLALANAILSDLGRPRDPAHAVPSAYESSCRPGIASDAEIRLMAETLVAKGGWRRWASSRRNWPPPRS